MCVVLLNGEWGVRLDSTFIEGERSIQRATRGWKSRSSFDGEQAGRRHFRKEKVIAIGISHTGEAFDESSRLISEVSLFGSTICQTRVHACCETGLAENGIQGRKVRVGGGDLAPRTIQPVLFALSPSLPQSSPRPSLPSPSPPLPPSSSPFPPPPARAPFLVVDLWPTIITVHLASALNDETGALSGLDKAFLQFTI